MSRLSRIRAPRPVQRVERPSRPGWHDGRDGGRQLGDDPREHRRAGAGAAVAGGDAHRVRLGDGRERAAGARPAGRRRRAGRAGAARRVAPGRRRRLPPRRARRGERLRDRRSTCARTDRRAHACSRCSPRCPASRCARSPRRPSRSEAPSRPRDGARPRAAFTIAHDEPVMLPLWLRLLRSLLRRRRPLRPGARHERRQHRRPRLGVPRGPDAPAGVVRPPLAADGGRGLPAVPAAVLRHGAVRRGRRVRRRRPQPVRRARRLHRAARRPGGALHRLQRRPPGGRARRCASTSRCSPSAAAGTRRSTTPSA